MADIEPVRIRPLVPEEVDRVSGVLGLARLFQGDGAYLVAWVGEEPAGHVYLALTIRRIYRIFRCEWSTDAAVSHPALTAAAEQEARGRRFDRLRLGVSVDNAAAQALYRGLGYGEPGSRRSACKGPS